MVTSSKLVRAELFYQVLAYRLDNPTSTIAEACNAVGIPVRNFYRWVAMENDAMDVVRDSLNDAQRTALFEFSQRIYSALTLLLNDAVNPALKTETRLTVLKYVIPLFDDYAKIHHATPGGEDRAPFLKKGPTLEKAQSRLATLDIAITEDGVRVDVMQEQPVIDSTARDVKEDQQKDPQSTQ